MKKNSSIVVLHCRVKSKRKLRTESLRLLRMQQNKRKDKITYKYIEKLQSEKLTPN